MNKYVYFVQINNDNEAYEVSSLDEAKEFIQDNYPDEEAQVYKAELVGEIVKTHEFHQVNK